MVVYGEALRPRIVAIGFGRSHQFASVVETYAGTVHYLSEDSDIRWQSWDAVVTVGRPTNLLDSHLRVLQLGGQPDGSGRGQLGYSESALSLTDTVGDEVEIPDGLPDDLLELVKRELLPLVDPRVHRRRIAPWGLAGAIGSATGAYLPLLLDLDRHAFAAIYRPPRGPAECIYLPENVHNIAPWLLYAFKRWATELPEVFPSQPEWTSNPDWMTSAELAAQSQLAERRAEEERVIAEQQARTAEAEALVAEIIQSADKSERQLLTATDAPLVSIVHLTLEFFGFEVTDVDAGLAEGQAKKEDLRVATGEWLALCEVKGFGKGGKATELQKLQGFATLYAVETGRPPTAMWYVVNQFLAADPSSRPQILRGADEFVEAFGQQGGLVIDTRDLFRLRKAVEADLVSPGDARAMLTGSTGRFQLPPNLQ